LFRMFLVIANFLAATAARQGAQGRPRHRRPLLFLPKGDCVPLGTLPEKRENVNRKQPDKPKSETQPEPLRKNLPQPTVGVKASCYDTYFGTRILTHPAIQ
ncbi:MAG: hypothetical protein II229_02465, partial [Clostridia bacterium]|nr:hypothetical protein [Clostridia bacterium]